MIDYSSHRDPRFEDVAARARAACARTEELRQGVAEARADYQAAGDW